MFQSYLSFHTCWWLTVLSRLGSLVFNQCNCVRCVISATFPWWTWFMTFLYNDLTMHRYIPSIYRGNQGSVMHSAVPCWSRTKFWQTHNSVVSLDWGRLRFSQMFLLYFSRSWIETWFLWWVKLFKKSDLGRGLSLLLPAEILLTTPLRYVINRAAYCSHLLVILAVFSDLSIVYAVI